MNTIKYSTIIGLGVLLVCRPYLAKTRIRISPITREAFQPTSPISIPVKVITLGDDPEQDNSS